MGTVGSAAVVLLCAEEDDLELVRWVHAARGQGLAPEVVTGIEHDDRPMLEALRQTEEALFVVLRSDNLSSDRMREIKAAFAQHHGSKQRLVALRLDATAEAAVERIAKQLAGGLGSRSENSLTLALEDVVLQRVRQGTGSHPAIVASRAAREDDAERTRAARATEAEAVQAALVDTAPDLAAPNVPTALAWANVTNERATTSRYAIDDETLPLPMVEAASTPSPRAASRLPMIGGIVIALSAAVGIAWWLVDATAPGETTEDVVPAASSGRVSVPKSSPDPTAAPEPTPSEVEPAVVEIDADPDEPRAAPTRRARSRSHERTREELPPPPVAIAATPSESPAAPPPPTVGSEAAPVVETTAIPSEPAPLEGETQATPR
ncbi:MAG TPA: hypothetical protein VG755_26235 [Nannocystaceae bacterium]|nr:hypothetical protein [Nannocystaceae bacterium]